MNRFQAQVKMGQGIPLVEQHNREADGTGDKEDPLRPIVRIEWTLIYRPVSLEEFEEVMRKIHYASS